MRAVKEDQVLVQVRQLKRKVALDVEMQDFSSYFWRVLLLLLTAQSILNSLIHPSSDTFFSLFLTVFLTETKLKVFS